MLDILVVESTMTITLTCVNSAALIDTQKKKCKWKVCYRYCAGEHEDRICNQKGNLKYINCTKSNEKYIINWQTNHTADNKEVCESYKQLLIRTIKNTTTHMIQQQE